MNENIQNDMLVMGQIRLECRRKDGSLKWDTGWIKNGITYAGFAALAGLAGNVGSVSAFTYLALGTSSTAFAGSQTALSAEITTNGLARAAATVTRATISQTNDTLQLQKVFTASGGAHTVEEVGMFNASSAGVMLGRALTTTKPVADGETITATYRVKFSA